MDDVDAAPREDGDAFDSGSSSSQLRYVTTSTAAATTLAENYVGLDTSDDAAVTEQDRRTAAARSPPFRADHVGSLLRPPQLLQARDDFAAGRSTRPSCARSRTTRSASAVQHAGGRRAAVGDRRRVPPRLVAHGLHLPARRHHARRPGDIAVKFHNEDGDIEFTPAALHVDGKLGVSKTIFGDDFAFLQETVDDEPSRS